MTRHELLRRVWANEDQMQADCWQYAYNEYIELHGLYFHVPNGGFRDVREGMKFKGMGVLAGTPDIVNMYNVPCGIELKMEYRRNLKNGGLSDNQVKIHKHWRAAGREVYVVYNAEEYLWVLENKVIKKEIIFTLA